MTQGAQNGVFTAAACVLDPGDEVIVLDPCYVTYPAVLTARTDRIRRVSLSSDDGWVLRPSALAEAVTPRTRAILLNSPANPTGVALPPDVWQAVDDICIGHDLWLISDEVYATLTYDRPHLSPRTLPGMAERTLSVFSLSKGWAMTGFRCGWVVGPAEAITAAEEVVTAVNFGIPPFVQQAALTALGEAADVAGRIRDIYAERRDAICGALESRAGLAVRRPDAGMFVLLDVRHLGRDATDIAWDLLDSQGVSLVPADAFGPALAGHLRLSFSQPVERLLVAAERIAAFLAS